MSTLRSLNCTGCLPPSGSTMRTVIRAAIGFPFGSVTRTVYGQVAFTFGVRVATASVALNGSAADGEAVPAGATVILRDRVSVLPSAATTTSKVSGTPRAEAGHLT